MPQPVMLKKVKFNGFDSPGWILSVWSVHDSFARAAVTKYHRLQIGWPNLFSHSFSPHIFPAIPDYRLAVCIHFYINHNNVVKKAQALKLDYPCSVLALPCIS